MAAAAEVAAAEEEAAVECRPRQAVRLPWAAAGAEPQHDPRPRRGRRQRGGSARRGRGGAARPGAGAGGARPGVGAGGAGANVAAGARPSAGQVNNFLDVPRASTGAVGAGGGARPGAGGAAGEFLQGGGGAAAAQLPAGAGVGAAAAADPALPPVPALAAGAAGARAQNLASNRPARVENRQELQGNRQQRRDEVRNQVAENHPRMDFWSDHPGWAAWRITRALSLGDLGRTGRLDWLRCGRTDHLQLRRERVLRRRPGLLRRPGGRDGRRVCPAGRRDRRQRAANEPESSEWLPLGVFALTQDGQASGVEPTLFMQLAISKEGVIAGTLKNMATGQVQTLEGMADKKSQRVAWGVAGQKRPIMETGISNLTQDSSPALIHFADGQTQQWLLVRLPEPKQG